ncbi:MAG: tyrosine-type recombinase/integrase [Actinomycetota bacterium]|nr:tyrosine-type recombinase/integrase [Actinomycetota bacterium]
MQRLLAGPLADFGRWQQWTQTDAQPLRRTQEYLVAAMSAAAATEDLEAEQLEDSDADDSPQAEWLRLARYLHTLGAIDATEILMVAGPRRDTTQETARDALDRRTWERVKHLARAREAGAASGRASHAAALRDTAIVMLLGEAGLRNEELRQLRREDVLVRRSDGTRPWLRVHGKGAKQRQFPLRTEAIDALTRWERARPAELAEDPLLLPRLGRRRVDGTFPEAGGALSGKALTAIVKPIMIAAGVTEHLAHPHVLRHTFGSLWMTNDGELSELQRLMGHASPATTSIYVHHTAHAFERAVERQDRGPSVLDRHARG